MPLDVKDPLRLQYRSVFASMAVSDPNQLSLTVDTEEMLSKEMDYHTPTWCQSVRSSGQRQRQRHVSEGVSEGATRE